MNETKTSTLSFDVIVIGGGHAGIEAAYAAARLGSKTALVSLSEKKIGAMSCNPAVGGIGKGHIVFEIAAFGGLMPQLCSKTYLQARMLNTSKGPAVQGLRLQIDRLAYQDLSQVYLKQTPNLTIIEDEVVDLIINEEKIVTGVRLAKHGVVNTKAVVVTTGTFLRGISHIGTQQKEEGRRGEKGAYSLSDALKKLNLNMGRLKTGTPPRLKRSSLDYDQMTPQQSDPLTHLFEFYPIDFKHKHDCYITETNETGHAFMRGNFHLSPLFSGGIQSRGPRYCPSIEDKLARFPEKTSHRIFLEPESLSSDEMYPNGISTSMPREVQEQFIRSIKGFERAEIVHYGYAIEYDFVFPNQLHHSLEVKTVSGLFLAGQINGTTGYEEAAGQGLVAGINAHLKSHDKPAFTLSRQESYIGIMIDDLVTLSVNEPYRMFTSRAERRLILRQDNTFFRLADKSYALGALSDQMYNDIKAEQELILSTIQKLKTTLSRQQYITLLQNEESNIALLHELTNNTLSDRVIQSAWAEIRYEPYIARELKEVEKAEKYHNLELPADIDFHAIDGLSKELRGKLTAIKPQTIAQATLIEGMTPAALSLLIYYARKKNK
jgi:tRNA uridine 5-carboxymethylaminomethyl modification enzyme